jgi:hypothetical protein
MAKRIHHHRSVKAGRPPQATLGTRHRVLHEWIVGESPPQDIPSRFPLVNFERNDRHLPIPSHPWRGSPKQVFHQVERRVYRTPLQVAATKRHTPAE